MVLALPATFDGDVLKQAASTLSDDQKAKLEQCDSRYFKNNESIERRLFTFAEERRHEIRIPSAT
jgi:hypothetical protein